MKTETFAHTKKQDASATSTWGAADAVEFDTTPAVESMPAYESLSDTELIRLIKTEDEFAWESLMTRHSSKAFQIAYGILGQWNDAEEVAQDAFVRVYRALDGFRGDAQFSTWFYRIVVNQARNKYRWNKRRHVAKHYSINEELDPNGTGAMARDLPDKSKGPAEQLMFREWESEVAQEMSALPSVNREALVLRNVHNFSYEQIAEVLGCKLGTVKSRIARARDELRKRVGI
ncbi:MAG TPA: RNA polymerase subunit sigma-24 [Lentisphaeria bacterium]|nr:RNA polymerase subunit sigma-24 [Lentisphaeria bacterium]